MRTPLEIAPRASDWWRANRLDVLSAAALTGLVFAVYGFVLRYTILGGDSLALIEVSRVGSWSDLADNFSESFMGGEWPYYRPLENLSLALDWALFGLEPFGWQLVNLLVFAAATVALFQLARRCLGRAAWLAPLLALLFFVFHASHVTAIPAVSRRHDALCLFFVLLALLGTIARDGTPHPGMRWRAGVFSLFAIGVKETGFVAPALVLAAVFLLGPGAGLPERLRRTLRASPPLLLSVAVALGARFAVLGSMGGKEGVGFHSLGRYRGILDVTLFPQPIMLEDAVHAWLPWAVLSSLCIAVVLMLRRPPRQAWRVFVLGLLFALAAATVKVYGQQMRAGSYVLFPLAGFALALSAVFHDLGRGLRAERPGVRIVSAVALLPLLFLIGYEARRAPPFQHYAQWDVASRLKESHLAAIEARIEASRDGEVLVFEDLPWTVLPDRPEAFLVGVSVLNRSTLEGWIRLRFPEREILVRARGPDVRPIEGGLVLVAEFTPSPADMPRIPRRNERFVLPDDWRELRARDD